ncbi:MAG: helix-turn-helix transcriptional regulator [Clostridia bacterium]|nr:helix-turn-helix transcriptional regulator [Clostridia bacterium]
MIKFPERLKELRLEKGLSRQQLANLLFVNLRTISYWELGQRECNLEQLAKLSTIFNVSTDYLLGLED